MKGDGGESDYDGDGGGGDSDSDGDGDGDEIGKGDGSDSGGDGSGGSDIGDCFGHDHDEFDQIAMEMTMQIWQEIDGAGQH